MEFDRADATFQSAHMTPAARRRNSLLRSAFGFFAPAIRTFSATAIVASISLVCGAEDSSPAWRQLPLITNGKVNHNWVHTGWGGFVVDGDALRTECDPRGLGLLVFKKERFGDCQFRVVYKSK